MLKKNFISNSCGWLILVMLGCGCSCEPGANDTGNYYLKATGTTVVNSTNGHAGKTSLEGSFNPHTNLLLYHVSWDQLGRPASATCLSVADHSGSEMKHTYIDFEETPAVTGRWYSRLILNEEQAEALVGGRLFFSLYTGNDSTDSFIGRIEAKR